VSESDKSPVIDLPVSLVLTDDGLFFFNTHQNRKEKQTGGGMSLDSFPAATLQRMILAGYVSSVQLSRSDFTCKRQELMDVAKLIMYGSLYRHFIDSVWKFVAVSDLMVQYNRTHPKIPFTKEHLSQGGSVLSSRAEGSAAARELMETIVSDVARIIENEDKDLSGDERKVIRSLGTRYLNNITAPFWLLLAGGSDTHSSDVMISTLRELLILFLRKSRITDYLALLLMELGVYAEQKLVHRAAEELFKGNIDPEAIMRNGEARSRVLAEMERQGARVTLVWKIRGRTTSIGTDNRLEILLYNRDSDAETLKKQIENRKGLGSSKHSLSDYYASITSSGTLAGSGCFYLDYIDEECARQKIRFESHVSRVDKSDLTLVRLVFHFR
jgi:hypothetical protein